MIFNLNLSLTCAFFVGFCSIACDNDVVCKQKMNCYISAALAEEYPDYIKLVRCPYGEWRRTTSDSSDDDDDSSSSSSDSSIKDRHPSSSSSSSSSKHSDDSDDDDSP